MVKLNFTDPLLEKIFRRWKWNRNITLGLFESAEENNILDFVPSSDPKRLFTFQPILFQFQCLVTTTDAYFRKMSDNTNQSYGILIENNQIISKKELTPDRIEKHLKRQIDLLDDLYKLFTSNKLEENISEIMSLSSHESLHQGQLILMFRQAGVELPKKFRTAWAL